MLFKSEYENFSTVRECNIFLDVRECNIFLESLKFRFEWVLGDLDLRDGLKPEPYRSDDNSSTCTLHTACI